MPKSVLWEERDFLISLGIVISAHRKLNGTSQEALALKAGISRSQLSGIEAPGMVRNFTMAAFFQIADALCVEPIVMPDEAKRLMAGGGLQDGV